jgi:hypothetical protein
MSYYQRLAAGSTGPNICRAHQLLNYTKVQAEIDAALLRESAVADTPPTLAQANHCSESDKEIWHIYIPTKARMRTLRKRARQRQGTPDVPRETSTTEEEK